jgi:hypothetical protein
MWKGTLRERHAGFPSLMQAIALYEQKKDESTVRELRTKKRPARKAAEIVAEYARAKREAERQYNQSRAIIDYYEYVAPFLIDLREEQESAEPFEPSPDYSEEERSDGVTTFLAKDEFRRLPVAERNQLALTRFLQRRNKPKWLVGRLYERYIGYLYEKEGYHVVYHGIVEGREDLGRDLICRKDEECFIIQCKNWSQFKTIFEKHIFQFFGTTFQYKDSHRDLRTRGAFCTTTKVSDLSRRFANELEILLFENFPLDLNYPCIKCNISRANGERFIIFPSTSNMTTYVSSRPEANSIASRWLKQKNEGFVVLCVIAE